VQAAKFEGGLILLPHHADWLAEFEAELFAFPGGRHDDQIDSMVQALSHDLRSGRVGWKAVRGLY
jgi:predicted phage terminase large subunit-like protein